MCERNCASIPVCQPELILHRRSIFINGLRNFQPSAPRQEGLVLHTVGCDQIIQTPELVCHLKLYVKPQREIVCSLLSKGAMEVSSGWKSYFSLTLAKSQQQSSTQS